MYNIMILELKVDCLSIRFPSLLDNTRAYLSCLSELILIPPLFFIFQQVHTQPMIVSTSTITTIPSRAPRADGSV